MFPQTPQDICHPECGLDLIIAFFPGQQKIVQIHILEAEFGQLFDPLLDFDRIHGDGLLYRYWLVVVSSGLFMYGVIISGYKMLSGHNMGPLALVYRRFDKLRCGDDHFMSSVF